MSVIPGVGLVEELAMPFRSKFNGPDYTSWYYYYCTWYYYYLLM